MARDRLRRASLARRNRPVPQKLTLRYDTIGDILHVETCPPYAEQECDSLEDDIVGSYNPDTEELESLEILFFSKRFPRGALGAGVVLPFFVRGPKADPPFKVPPARSSRARSPRAKASSGSRSRARRR
jgi:hypothetical protein